LVILLVKEDNSLDDGSSPFGQIIVQEAVSKMEAVQTRHNLIFNGPHGSEGYLKNIPLNSSAGVDSFTDQLISLLKQNVSYSNMLKFRPPPDALIRFIFIYL